MTTQDIITNFPSIVTTGLAIIVTGFGWLIKDKLNQMAKTDERLENRIDKMDDKFERRFEKVESRFEKIDDRLEKIDNRFEKLEDKIGSIKEMVAKIQAALVQTGYLNDRILTATSPLKLTEYGKRIVKESTFDKIFEKNKDEILGWVKEYKPETRWDAQEAARKVLLSHYDASMFTLLRYYAYERGNIYPELILLAGSIVVRDAIIEKLGLEK